MWGCNKLYDLPFSQNKTAKIGAKSVYIPIYLYMYVYMYRSESRVFLPLCCRKSRAPAGLKLCKQPLCVLKMPQPNFQTDRTIVRHLFRRPKKAIFLDLYIFYITALAGVWSLSAAVRRPFAGCWALRWVERRGNLALFGPRTTLASAWLLNYAPCQW